MTSNIEYICEGCTKVNKVFLTCGVYASPPSLFINLCKCPFNMPKEKVLKVKERVGQQKTKRRKGKN